MWKVLKCGGRRSMKITWNDRVKNEVVLRRVKQERLMLFTVKREKGNWIGQIVCRNCLLKHVFKEKWREG
jgi:hypothetical protein